MISLICGICKQTNNKTKKPKEKRSDLQWPGEEGEERRNWRKTVQGTDSQLNVTECQGCDVKHDDIEYDDVEHSDDEHDDVEYTDHRQRTLLCDIQGSCQESQS